MSRLTSAYEDGKAGKPFAKHHGGPSSAAYREWQRGRAAMEPRRRRAGTAGTRVFNGRHYLLAGRGTKAECERAARLYRQQGDRYVRVVPWNPFYEKRLRGLLDDYALFTFPKEPTR